MSASTRPSTWAKSPSFADQPDRVEAIATQTAIDKINYLDSGLSEVACHSCGTCVLVRKNSFRQTSVQWQSDPNVTCPVFRDTDAPRGLPQPAGQHRAGGGRRFPARPPVIRAATTTR